RQADAYRTPSELDLLLCLLYRLAQKFLQGRQVNVVKSFYVETSPAKSMFTQFLHQVGVLVKAARYVESQVLFARRESNYGPVTLSAARILNATDAKADDVSSPHPRFRSSCFLHQLRDGDAVLPSSFILYTFEKLDDTCFSGFCFCFGHVLSI